MNRREYENKIYDKVKDYFQELAETSYEISKIQCKLRPEESNSEIQIYIYKENELFDVFEFFVFYDNQPNITEQEVTEYLDGIKSEILK